MFRKRYTVVVVGLRGSSAAQRSEISRHRRERDALAAGAEERDRLSVAQGALAANYEVVVERDGIVVEVFSHGGDSGEAFPLAHAAGSDDQDAEFEPVDVDRSEHGGVDDDTDAEDTGGIRIPTRETSASDGPPAPRGDDRPPRLPSWDDIPTGPVPDDVLRYFESAVAREERRRHDRYAEPDPPED